METIIAELLSTAATDKKGGCLYLVLALVLIAGWLLFEYYTTKK